MTVVPGFYKGVCSDGFVVLYSLTSPSSARHFSTRESSCCVCHAPKSEGWSSLSDNDMDDSLAVAAFGSAGSTLFARVQMLLFRWRLSLWMDMISYSTRSAVVKALC